MKLIYRRLGRTGIILVIILAMCLCSAIMAEESARRYVGSKRSDKYHLPNCKWARKIRTSNQIWFNTIAEAKAAEYQACSVCNPASVGTTAVDEVTPELTEQRQKSPQATRVPRRIQSKPMGRRGTVHFAQDLSLR